MVDKEELRKAIEARNTASSNNSLKDAIKARNPVVESEAEASASLTSEEPKSAFTSFDNDSVSKYAGFLNAADFDKYNDYSKVLNPTLKDFGLDYFNLVETAGKGHDITTNGEYIDYLTDDEKKVAGYLYNRYGKDVYNQYFKDMSDTLAKRRSDYLYEFSKKNAEEHPVASAIGARALNAFAGLESLAQNTKSLLTEGKMNPYAANFSNIVSAVDAGVSENIDSDLGKFVYSTGMSMVDSAINMLLMKGLGELGMSAKAIDKISAVPFALNAFQTTYKEKVDEGIPEDNAILTATAAGIAEYAFEHIAWDSLMNIIRKPASSASVKGAVKSLVMDALKQAGTEGTEEALTDISNAIADSIINQDMSEYSRRIQAYIENGYTEAEAKSLALSDLAKQIGESFAGGAISGGIFGGVGSTIAGKDFAQIGKDISSKNNVSRLAEMADEANAEYINSKLESGEKISNVELGKLANQIGTDAYTEAEKILKSDASIEVKEDAIKKYIDIQNKLGNAIDIDNSEKAVAERKAEYEKDMTEGQKEVFDKYFDNEHSTEYFAEFMRAYKAGYSADADIDSLVAKSEYLQGDALIEAYKQGNADYANGVTNSVENTLAKFKKNGHSVSGSLKVDSNINVNKLTGEKQMAYIFAKGLSEIGYDIRLVQTTAQQRRENFENGLWNKESGELMIDLNAGIISENGKVTESQVLSTLSHELTHSYKAYAPTEYRELQASCLSFLSAKSGLSVDALIQREIANNASVDNAEDAKDELVARACEDMLNSADSMFLIYSSMSEKSKKSFKDFVKKFFEDIWKALGEIKNLFRSASWEAKALNSMQDSYKKLQEKWQETFLASAEAMKKAKEAESAAEEVLVDYSAPANEAKSFSTRTTLESTDKLMALHNLRESDLLATIKLGGFACPSIAIKRAYLPHTEYGDITVVFGKATIDPKWDKGNNVFSGDAWTPVFPSVDIKVSRSKQEEIENKVKELVGGRDEYYRLGSDGIDYDNMSDKLNRWKDPVKSYYDSETLKYAFLKDTGKAFELPTKEKQYLEGDISNDALGAIALTIGDETLEQMHDMGYSWYKENLDLVDELRLKLNEAYIREHEGEVADIDKGTYNEKVKANLKKFFYNRFNDEDGKLPWHTFDKVVNAMYSLNKRGRTQVMDTKAFTEKLKETVDQTAYEKWLKELFDGIVEKEGIRNNVDFFTPSGNRRSFEALHWEVTLENVVKVMKQQAQQGSVDTPFGAQLIWGVATRKYSSIADMKSDIGRLVHQNEEERDALREKYTSRFVDIAQEISDKKNPNPFIATDDAGEAIVDSLRGAKTEASINRRLKEYTQLNIHEDTAKEVLDLYNDILKMPTDYFEAKPVRAVGLNEIAYVVIPSDSSEDLKKALTNNGIVYHEYAAGNDEDRVKVTNEHTEDRADVLFSSRKTEKNLYSEGESFLISDEEYARIDQRIKQNKGTILLSGEHAFILDNLLVYNKYGKITRIVKAISTLDDEYEITHASNELEEILENEQDRKYKGISLESLLKIRNAYNRSHLGGTLTLTADYGSNMYSESIIGLGRQRKVHKGAHYHFEDNERRTGNNSEGTGSVQETSRVADKQTITSADTSLNQTPATFTNFEFKPTDRILDYGGGRYDTAKRTLESVYPGIKVEVVDAFNRTIPHNERIYKEYENKKANIVTINNVLNVINSDKTIDDVIKDAKKYLTDDGICYIAIYEGNGTGNGEKTSKGWQNNRKTADYVPFVEKHFKNVKKTGNFIIASDSTIDGRVTKISEVTRNAVDSAKEYFKAQKLDRAAYAWSNRVKQSEADYESLYGEKTKLAQENRILKANAEKLLEKAKKYKSELNTKQSKDFVRSEMLKEARQIKRELDSTMSIEDIAGRLSDIYFKSENPKEDIKRLLDSVVDKEKKSLTPYGKEGLALIKGARLKASESQIKEAEFVLGKDWRKKFFGKVVFAKDAAQSLDSWWSEMADNYSWYGFDKDISDAEQITALADIIETLSEKEGVSETVDRDEYIDNTADKVVRDLDKIRKIKTYAGQKEEEIKLQGKITKGLVLADKDAEKIINSLLKEYNASADTKTKADLVSKLKDAYALLNGNTDEYFVLEAMNDIAKEVAEISKGTLENPVARMIMRQIKQASFNATDAQIAELKARFGKDFDSIKSIIRIDNAGVDAYEWYKNMQRANGIEVFPNVTERNVLSELYNVYNRLSEASKVLKNVNASEMQNAIVSEIQEALYTTLPYESVADKYAGEIKKLKYKHETELKALKEQNAKVMANFKEKLSREELLGKILKKASDLRDKVIKNSKEKHINVAFRDSVAEFLDALDFSGTSKAKTASKKLARVAEYVENAIEGKEKLDDIDISMFASFDNVVYEKLVEVKEMFEALEEQLGDTKFTLSKMSAEQLGAVNQVLTVIEKAIKDVDLTLAGSRRAKISELGTDFVEYADTMAARNSKGFFGTDAGDRLKAHFTYDQLLPVYYFKLLGKSGNSLFTSVQDGWDAFTLKAKAIEDFTKSLYTSEEANEWENTVHTIELSNGTVTLTTAQLMSFYCLSKREQGLKHIHKGGIRIGNFTVGKDTYRFEKGVDRLSDADIDKMVSVLEKEGRAKAVADAMQNFMSNECSDWGNEVSLRRYGIKSFLEKYYFPIVSDNNLVNAKEFGAGGQNLLALLNASFTQELNEKASNKIMIYDIFDVFASHTSSMAMYNAMALPCIDIIKFYNFKQNILDEEGNIVSVMSVRQSMEKAFGNEAKTYLTQFVRDINGGSESRLTATEGLARKLIRNAKAAAVGFNFRVAFLQVTSYVRASAIMDTKYLASGISSALEYKKYHELALKYCPMALWKSMGHYDMNIARTVASEIKGTKNALQNVMELSMKAAEFGDSFTWAMLYKACLTEAKAEGAVGEDAYIRAGLRLRQIIYETQVVDSTVTRSQSMRDRTTFMQLLNAFRGEPTVSYNMLLSGKMAYDIDKRIHGKEVAWNRNKKKIGRSFLSVAMTMLFAGMVGGWWDYIRNTDEDKDIDDYLAAVLKDNVMGDVLGLMPYGNVLYSELNGYSTERMDTAVVSSMVKAGQNIEKVIEGEPVNYKKIYSVLKSASQATGIPLSALYRDIIAIWNETVGDIYPSLKIK